jgi:hypothetical protein
VYQYIPHPHPTTLFLLILFFWNGKKERKSPDLLKSLHAILSIMQFLQTKRLRKSNIVNIHAIVSVSISIIQFLQTKYVTPALKVQSMQRLNVCPKRRTLFLHLPQRRILMLAVIFKTRITQTEKMQVHVMLFMICSTRTKPSPPTGNGTLTQKINCFIV